MSLDMLGVEITIVLPLFDGLYKNGPLVWVRCQTCNCSPQVSRLK